MSASHRAAGRPVEGLPTGAVHVYRLGELAGACRRVPRAETNRAESPVHLDRDRPSWPGSRGSCPPSGAGSRLELPGAHALRRRTLGSPASTARTAAPARRYTRQCSRRHGRDRPGHHWRGVNQPPDHRPRRIDDPRRPLRRVLHYGHDSDPGRPTSPSLFVWRRHRSMSTPPSAMWSHRPSGEPGQLSPYSTFPFIALGLAAVAAAIAVFTVHRYPSAGSSEATTARS